MLASWSQAVLNSLDNTLRPAYVRFAEIERIYFFSGDVVPEDVQDGWTQFERAVEWACYEIRTGLWL